MSSSRDIGWCCGCSPSALYGRPARADIGEAATVLVRKIGVYQLIGRVVHR